jgi:hypothetical protein
MNYAISLIGRGLAQADIGPSLDVFDRINDPAAELPVAWAGAMRAMFLQRAVGDAKHAGDFRSPKVARRRRLCRPWDKSGLSWPSLLIDGVTGAPSRISGSDKDDEDRQTQTVHPLKRRLLLG